MLLEQGASALGNNHRSESENESGEKGGRRQGKLMFNLIEKEEEGGPFHVYRRY